MFYTLHWAFAIGPTPQRKMQIYRHNKPCYKKDMDPKEIEKTHSKDLRTKSINQKTKRKITRRSRTMKQKRINQMKMCLHVEFGLLLSSSPCPLYCTHGDQNLWWVHQYFLAFHHASDDLLRTLFHDFSGVTSTLLVAFSTIWQIARFNIVELVT